MEVEVDFLKSTIHFAVRFNVVGSFLRLVLDQDERIQELESAVARLGEDAVDRVSLLEDMQSDKETISRAMQQNKAMKDQLEELEKGFVKIVSVGNPPLLNSYERKF